jgi:hypothetical protein
MSDYKVVITYKVRHVLKVGTDSPESAESFADELIAEHVNWNELEYDTLISEYSSTVIDE